MSSRVYINEMKTLVVVAVIVIADIITIKLIRPDSLRRRRYIFSLSIILMSFVHCRWAVIVCMIIIIMMNHSLCCRLIVIICQCHRWQLSMSIADDVRYHSRLCQWLILPSLIYFTLLHDVAVTIGWSLLFATSRQPHCWWSLPYINAMYRKTMLSHQWIIMQWWLNDTPHCNTITPLCWRRDATWWFDWCATIVIRHCCQSAFKSIARYTNDNYDIRVIPNSHHFS